MSSSAQVRLPSSLPLFPQAGLDILSLRLASSRNAQRSQSIIVFRSRWASKSQAEVRDKTYLNQDFPFMSRLLLHTLYSGFVLKFQAWTLLNRNLIPSHCLSQYIYYLPQTQFYYHLISIRCIWTLTFQI